MSLAIKYAKPYTKLSRKQFVRFMSTGGNMCNYLAKYDNVGKDCKAVIMGDLDKETGPVGVQEDIAAMMVSSLAVDG